MANRMGVQVVLEAEDRARGVLDQFGNTVVDLSEKSERGLVRMETAMARTTRGVRALAIPLISELAPAMDTTVSRIAGVTTGALMLSSGLTALAIAAAGIAGVIGGQLLQAWRKNREELEQFDRAVRSFDMGPIGAQAAKTRGELENVRVELAKINTEIARHRNVPRMGGPAAMPGALGTGSAAEAERGNLEARRQQLERHLDLLKTQIERLEEEAQLRSSMVAARAADEVRARRFFELERSQAGLMDFRLQDPLQIEFRQSMREARDLRLEGQPEAAERLERAARARRQFFVGEDLSRARFAVRAAEEAPFAEAVGAGGPLSADDVERIRAFQRREFELDLALRHGAQAREEAPFAEAVGAGGPLSAEDARRFREDAERRRREPFAITLSRARIFEGQEGLTRDQRDALAFQRIEAERASRLSDITLTPERIDLVNLEARVGRENLARVRAETTEAAAGLSRGFQDVEDEWGQVGVRMQEIARGTADNMHRAFSDNFFAVVTGDFKRLPEIGRQFGAAMVRTILEELSRLAIAPLLGSLRTGFGALGLAGATTFLPVSATAGLPGGISPAAMIPFIGGGGGAPFIGGGGGGSAVTMLQQQGIRVLSDPGGIGTFGVAPASGGFGVPPLPITGLLPSGGSALLQTSGAVVPISGGLFSDFLAAPLIPMQAGQTAGTSLATMTAGQALGGAAGAAGLGFTVYSALQGPPTAQNIIFSAASGALSGALLGSVIPGVGTVIGAVAGGIIGGGAGALGKGGAKKKGSANERSAAAAQAGAANLSSAIAQAQTLEDMVRVLNGKWSPFNEINILAYSGGPPFIGTSAGPGGALAIVKGNGESGPFFTVEGFLSDRRFIDNLSIQVGPGGSAVHNVALTEQAQDKLRGLVGDIEGMRARILLGFEETLQAPGGAAITRATVLSATRGEEARGQQLMVFEDTILGLSDVAKEFLLRELARLDVDKSLKLIRLDPGARVPLAVGAYTLPAGT